jgi:23S rRNA (adenine2030-N6)-methyltransferase
MNYRHGYHAGNFADAFKHILLTALIQSFLKKETAFCYLETHAGAGQYDLLSEIARKNKEFETGVSKILAQQNPPAIIQQYLDCVAKINPNNELNFYPGSPFFARQFLRKHDRMVLSELHEQEYLALKKMYGHDKLVAVHHLDGYQNLKAFLPPKERRGLVLIDPPYEKHDEFAYLMTQIPQAVERWETGVFALWYPIKDRRTTDRFISSLKNKITKPTLTLELSIYPENTTTHLNGSGIFIINPPWQFDQQCKEILPWLWKVLSVNEQGRYFIS